VKESDTLPIELPLLKKLIPRGIPRNSAVLLVGDPGVGKTMLLAHIALSLLRSGEPVVFVSLDDDPLALLQVIEGLGAKPRGYLERGLLRIVDSYSFRFGHLRGRYELAVESVGPGDLLRLLNVLNNLARGAPGRGAVFVDSLNELLFHNSEYAVAEFVKSLRALLPKMKRVAVFLTLHTSLDVYIEFLSMIEHSVDGVIVMEFDPSTQVQGAAIRRLYVRKLRGTPHSHRTISFTITERGFALHRFELAKARSRP